MTTLAVRRPHLPMSMIVALAAATWTVAWFANLALADWAGHPTTRLKLTVDAGRDHGHRSHVVFYRLSCACPWRR